MDRERLFRHLEQRYTSKREMISRIPLGAQTESLWQELLSRRRAKSTVLPICNAVGMPFWYVTTDKMVSASEKVVEMLLENEQDFDPYTEAPNVVTLEEAFYTGYVDGAGITMQDAMVFLQSGSPPRDVEEQLIVNNRQAGAFATKYLYRPIDVMYLQELAAILTDGLDEGGGEFRVEDWIQIPSMMDEPYKLPTARTVPDRAAELVRMLDDPKLHPLIKSAAAQAWALTVRPFLEGNERLGRVLSAVVLLRSGYTFFSELSLSALIAQKGYGYYDAIANILREENGGDLTYFMEYFLDLLSRAVDERQRREGQAEKENLEAEILLAHAPLTAAEPPAIPEDAAEPEQMVIPDEPAEPPPKPQPNPVMSAKQLKSALMSVYDDWPDNVKGAAARGMISYLDAGKYEFSTADLEDDFGIQGYEKSSLLKRLRKEGVVEMTRQGQRCFFYRFCVNEKEARGAQNRVLSEDCTEAEHMSVKNTIAQFAPALKESKFKRAVRALPAFVDRGKYQFTSLDFASELNLRQKDASWFGTCLMKGGLITVVGKAGKAFLYAFCIPESEEAAVISEPPDEEEQELDLKGFFSQSPLLKDSDYSLEILERIRLLRTSNVSPRDRRIGSILTHCLPKGVVTFGAYDDETVNSRWAEDMKLVEQMGIVEKVNEKEYRILREVKPGLPSLMVRQKNVLTKIFQLFGTEVFSKEMVVATLDYSRPHASAILHQFTLIRILEKKPEKQDGSPVYQLLVNPDDHPECFNGAA